MGHKSGYGTKTTVTVGISTKTTVTVGNQYHNTRNSGDSDQNTRNSGAVTKTTVTVGNSTKPPLQWGIVPNPDPDPVPGRCTQVPTRVRTVPVPITRGTHHPCTTTVYTRRYHREHTREHETSSYDVKNREITDKRVL